MRLYQLLATRSLRARPLRMLLSGFGILLGVAAILAIGITNRAALDSVARLFQDSSGKSNLMVRSTDSEGRGMAERALTALRAQPGIGLAAPSLGITSVLADQTRTSDVSLSFFGFNTGSLLLQGIDPTLDPQVRAYTLVEGRWLDDADGDVIVLVKDFAVENKLQVGKYVQIVLPSGIQTLRLVGLIAKEGAGQQNNGNLGVLPLKSAQKITERTGKIDQIDLVVSSAFTSQAALEKLRIDLQAALGSGYTVVYPASQGQRMTQMLSNYQIGLNFMSGMALFVGAFLIFNAFWMTVVERTREFGMLRTVGMNRRQVLVLVLGEALLLGLLGSILGLISGILTASSLGRLMGVMLSQDIQVIEQIPQDTVLTGLLVGVLVSLLAAGIPAIQASRISPLAALHVQGQPQEGWLLRKGWTLGALLLIISAAILVYNPFPYDVQFRMGTLVVFTLFLGATLVIPATLHLWKRVLEPFIRLFYGRSGQLGSANVQRARLRTALTVTALLVGVAMIVVVWVMTDSFKGDLNEWLQGFIGGDLYIISSVPMRQDVINRVQAVPGVAAVTPVRYFDIKLETPTGARENLLFMGVEPDSYSHVSTFIFSAADPNPPEAMKRLAEGDVVFISTVIAERYNLKPGDSISLVTKSGPQPFLVAAVVVDYYNQGMVVRGSWLDMRRYFRLSDANTLLAKVDSGVEASGVAARIDDLYGKHDHLTIMTNQTLLQSILTLEQQAFSLFDVLALVTMAVGFFGITNTLTMNVLERTRELGMLRAVGMTRSQILKMILAEAVLIGLIGGIMGLILGIVLARIFMLAMTAMSGYRMAFVFPIEKALLALLIGLVTSQLAALFPALRAVRIRILDAIHYE
jgi:putative ABC transport system permease protein